jgi:hypothetical protein
VPRGRIVTANPVNGRHFLNRGRVAWWLPLPHLYGGGRLYDLKGLNHATLNAMGGASNGWRPTTRPGGWGHLLTDGTAGYVSAPVPAGIGGATAATIAGWVYRSATGTKQAFGFGTGSGANRFNLIWFTDNNIYCEVQAGYAYAVSTATGWHRLALVYDSAASPTSALYLDGVPLTLSIVGGGAFGSGALPSAANLGGYWIGREVANGYCAGSYDDLPVASRAWSAAEAWADYDLSRRGYPGVLNRRSPALLLLMPATAPVAGAAVLPAAATLTPAGSATVLGAASFAGLATLTPLGSAAVPGAGTLLAAATLTPGGSAGVAGAAVLGGTASILAGGGSLGAASAVLTAAATLSPAGSAGVASAASLAAVATLAAAG